MSNFVEITSNDNWFKQHPEKIAGVEYETTSFYFPIMVKGTAADVLRVTGVSEKEYTLDEILNNDLIKGEVEREDAELKKAGWSRKDIQGVADFVTKQANNTDKEKRLRLAKAKAKAIKVKLSLGQLGMANKLVKQRIKELVNFAFSNINNSINKTELINKISNDEVVFLKEKVGFNFDGYERILDKSSVIHTYNQHGNQKKESARGQIAITKKDFELIPEIVKSKNVINTEKNKNGAECIMYEAIIGDTFYYVEEIRKGKKKLCLKTMYKRKTNYTE